MAEGDKAMVDMTGKPRSDEELQESIDCIEVIMVRHATVLPLLTIHAGSLRDCLYELQARRFYSELEKESSRVSENKKAKAYQDAWNKLKNEVLDEKTSWGKEELKKRMDAVLIECMETCLDRD